MGIFKSILSKLGLLKVSLDTMQAHYQALLHDLVDFADKQIGIYDRPAIEALAHSAILEAVSLLAHYQEHPYLNAYALHAVQSATRNEAMLHNIKAFSEAFRQYLPRLGERNSLPRELGKEIENRVFYEKKRGLDDIAHIEAVSGLMPMIYLEHYSHFIKTYRLP
jgi:hypothetical protein